MLTDAFALGLSLAVIRLVARPSGGNLTFGLKRAEILSAQANGFTLLVLAAADRLRGRRAARLAAEAGRGLVDARGRARRHRR